jgi:hypothetical protein
MSGPKVDAILARENDLTLKKKRKKPKNEDYIGGVAAKDDTGAGGLKMRDEDEWKLRGVEDVDLEGADAPGKLTDAHFAFWLGKLTVSAGERHLDIQEVQECLGDRWLVCPTTILLDQDGRSRTFVASRGYQS